MATNNLNITVLLTAKKNFCLVLADREVPTRDSSIIGETTLDFISHFSLDYGIFSISGIDLSGSLLKFDYHEVRTKRAIIENFCYLMLVTDHSKFRHNAIINLGNIN